MIWTTSSFPRLLDKLGEVFSVALRFVLVALLLGDSAPTRCGPSLHRMNSSAAAVSIEAIVDDLFVFIIPRQFELKKTTLVRTSSSDTLHCPCRLEMACFTGNFGESRMMASRWQVKVI